MKLFIAFFLQKEMYGKQTIIFWFSSYLVLHKQVISSQNSLLINFQTFKYYKSLEHQSYFKK